MLGIIKARYITEPKIESTCERLELDSSKLKYKCIERFVPRIFNRFLLDFSYNDSRIIKCLRKPYWKYFSYSFEFPFSKANYFFIKNCALEEDTALINIARVIGADESTTILMSNENNVHSIINKYTFQEFYKLHSLRIEDSYNSRTVIKDDAFEDMKNLKRLHLSVIIPKNIFKYTPYLEELHLYDCYSQIFQRNTFQYFKSLKLLNITLNNNKKISSPIFDDLVTLQRLNLNAIFLESISSNIFKRLTDLTHLSLRDNLLTSLAEDTFENNRKIVILNLENNRIKSLPSKIFNKLRALKYLYISYNYLKHLSENIFVGLNNLLLLDLHGNELNSLPDDIWRDLTKLKKLFIGYNKLKRITKYVVFKSFLKIIHNNKCNRH